MTLYYSIRRGEANKLQINIGIWPSKLLFKDSENGGRWLHETSPVMVIPNTFVVTSGLPYNPTEKLILPFNEATWIMIIISMFTGVLTIAIIYQFPKNIQNFVFGRQTTKSNFANG
jgi:hypothetical protein